jgi:hypothetical protein
MTAWQWYVWVFAVVLVLSAVGRTLLFFVRRELVTRFDVVEGWLGLIAIPALFGFAYGTPHGARWWWEFVAVMFVVLSIYAFFASKMHRLYAKGWGVSIATIAVMTLVGGPALWALVGYGFWRTDIWR